MKSKQQLKSQLRSPSLARQWVCLSLVSSRATAPSSLPVTKNAQVVDAINSGTCPFEEPGLPDLLFDLIKNKRLRASTDTATVVSESSVIVVIVPVLLTEDNQADTSVIDSVAQVIASNLKKRHHDLFETTLPVGHTRRLGKILETSGLTAGVRF